MTVSLAGMDSPVPSHTPPATDTGLSLLEITHVQPPAPKKTLGMKKNHWVQTHRPTAGMASDVGTASPVMACVGVHSPDTGDLGYPVFVRSARG